MKNLLKSYLFIKILSMGIIMLFILGCEEDNKYDLPTVSTNKITEITENSAKSGGKVTDDGGDEISTRGIVWSNEENPSLRNNDGSTDDGYGLGDFQSNLTNLSINTTYFVRAYATNIAGTSYGNEYYFKTHIDDIQKFLGNWNCIEDSELYGPSYHYDISIAHHSENNSKVLISNFYMQGFQEKVYGLISDSIIIIPKQIFSTGIEVEGEGVWRNGEIIYGYTANDGIDFDTVTGKYCKR